MAVDRFLQKTTMIALGVVAGEGGNGYAAKGEKVRT